MTIVYVLMMNVIKGMTPCFRNVHHRIEYVHHQNLEMTFYIGLFG
jgi:hypothetical protein